MQWLKCEDLKRCNGAANEQHERVRGAAGSKNSGSCLQFSFWLQTINFVIFQVELEKLNSSTDVINKLELDLEEARSHFRFLLNDSTRKLDQMTKELGPSAVEKSRGYYDAKMQARVALLEAQHAAARFEKASSALEAAKEMVTLAEEGFVEKGMQFDQAWQEMLNHATNRVKYCDLKNASK